MSVSGDNGAYAISCLPAKLFGFSGLEPCPQSDHSFSVLAEPVRRFAFREKVDVAFDLAFDRSAADRHLPAALYRVVRPPRIEPVRSEVVQPCRLNVRAASAQEFLQFHDDRSDFTVQ